MKLSVALREKVHLRVFDANNFGRSLQIRELEKGNFEVLVPSDCPTIRLEVVNLWDDLSFKAKGYAHLDFPKAEHPGLHHIEPGSAWASDLIHVWQEVSGEIAARTFQIRVRFSHDRDKEQGIPHSKIPIGFHLSVGEKPEQTPDPPALAA